MADAAVEFLLDNLQQLLKYHVSLIRDVHNKVEELENDLRLFKSFLSRCTKKRRKEDDGLREIIKKIRDVVYEAEDLIDAFVTQAAESKSHNYFKRAFSKPVHLHAIAEQVTNVASKIKRIYGDKNLLDFANFDMGDGEQEEKEVPIVKQENVVGLEDEAAKLIGYLKEKTDRLDAISIVGMPGLGKTTLAGKIFRDPEILYEFPTRIWVYVSSECTRKNVFLTILSEFTKVTEEIRSKKDEELAGMVSSHLQSGKFLIVMDDVWTPVD